MDDIFDTQNQSTRAKGLADQTDQEDKQRRINYGMVFSTREGFEVLKDIAAMCHINEISYVRGDLDETIFREGERNVFLYILSQLSDEMKSKLFGG